MVVRQTVQVAISAVPAPRILLNTRPKEEAVSGCGAPRVQEREDAALSDWDRFARTEYVRLALEEEGEGDLTDFPSENEVFAS